MVLESKLKFEGSLSELLCQSLYGLKFNWTHLFMVERSLRELLCQSPDGLRQLITRSSVIVVIGVENEA